MMAVFDDMGDFTLLYLEISLEIHVDLERANITGIRLFLYVLLVAYSGQLSVLDNQVVLRCIR